MVVSASGEIVGEYNGQIPFVPASIFKVVTALAALDTLGPEYRFQTYFYITSGIDLYIVGTGDPLLISEDIPTIAKSLQQRGIRKIRHIYIDNSRYQLKQDTINTKITKNPYDTALSAVGVNFNTMQIAVDDKGTIRSGEEQTPTLAIMQEKGDGLGAGVHRINLGADSDDLCQYAGQLFKAGFEQVGITVTGQIEPRTTPARAGLFFTHSSPPLKEMIPAMLLYSNNFMANQIYLKLGAKKYGYPVTWEKARQAMASFFVDNGMEKPLKIRDGAGLSRENRITCTSMIEILQRFRKYAVYLPQKQELPLKSGTMTGVYSYAGFLGNPTTSPAFVLILNQQENNRDALLSELFLEYGVKTGIQSGKDNQDRSRTTMDSK